MKIKELEEQLCVPKATIRFYEAEGLLTPERRANNYRDYGEADVTRLKQILILRKLGLSLPEVRGVLEGSLSLSEGAAASARRLEEEKKRLEGALSLCRRIQSREEQRLDTQRYWELIAHSEAQSMGFADIAKDYLEFESGIFTSVLKQLYFFDIKALAAKRGGPIAGAVLLGLCIWRGILWQFVRKTGTFWGGFLQPFLTFFLISVLLLPPFLLQKKHPKITQLYMRVLLVVCCLLLAAVAAMLLWGLVNLGIELITGG